MTFRRITACTVAGAIPCAVSVIGLAGIALADEPAVRVEKLPNSLEIVVVERTSLPLVAVHLWLDAGIRLDSEDCPHAAEFTAALLEAAVRDDDDVRRFDLPVDSFVWLDAVGIGVTAPAGLAEAALRAVSRAAPPDRLIDSYYVAASAALERDATDTDSAGFDEAERLRVALFAQHEYGKPLWHTSPSAPLPKPEQLRRHFDRWLAPGSATLIVAGDVLAPQAIEQARVLFKPWQWRQPQRLASPDPPAAGLVIRRSPARTGAVAFVAPPAGFFEASALDVLSELLTDPPIRTAGSPADVRSFPINRWERYGWREAGMVVFGTPAEVAANADSERGDNAFRNRLEAISKQPPEPEALIAARARARNAILASLSDFTDWARRLAEAEVVAGNVLDWHYAATRPMQVRADDVRAAAARLLDARRVIETVADRGARPETAPRRIDQITSLTQVSPSDDGPVSVQLRRAGGPAPVVTTSSPKSGIRVSLCALPEPALVVIAVRAERPANSATDPLRTADLSSEELSQLCRFRGWRIALERENDSVTWWTSCASDDALAAVEVLRDLVRTAGPSRAVRVAAAGPIDTAALQSWITECFGEFPIDAGIPDGSTARENHRVISDPPIDVSRVVARLSVPPLIAGAGNEQGAVTLVVAELLRDTFRELDLPRSHAPRVHTAWSSHSEFPAPARPLLDLAAIVTPAEARELCARWSALERSIRDSEIPLSKWTALRARAATRRLLELDGPGSIVRALLAGDVSPWDLAPLPSDETLKRAVADTLAEIGVTLKFDPAER